MTPLLKATTPSPEFMTTTNIFNPTLMQEFYLMYMMYLLETFLTPVALMGGSVAFSLPGCDAVMGMKDRFPDPGMLM